jgi:hypothetical protein
VAGGPFVGQWGAHGGNIPGGGYATVTLVDGGRGLTLSIAGGDNNFPFCKIVNGTKANSADCGA